jgi:hypothetical protein
MSECLMTIMSAQYFGRLYKSLFVDCVRDENTKEACCSIAFAVCSLSLSLSLPLSLSLSLSLLSLTVIVM